MDTKKNNESVNLGGLEFTAREALSLLMHCEDEEIRSVLLSLMELSLMEPPITSLPIKKTNGTAKDTQEALKVIEERIKNLLLVIQYKDHFVPALTDMLKSCRKRMGGETKT